MTHDAGHDRSGWGGALTPGPSPALVVIDVVRAYFDDGGVFQLPSTAALDAAAELLAAARTAGVPVVHTAVRYAPDGADGGVFFRKVAGLAAFAGEGPIDPDGPGGFRPETAPLPGELVITKQMPSAFFGTSLAGTLTARGVDTVVLCGVSTSGCVRASAVDAMSHGFIPVVVADACGDRSPTIHEANLADLAAKYAEVVDTVTAVAYLSAR
ncbi:isochorismatase family protein [Euzebya sp.]|uniref:isochorismatase family protein n=1 Tax=Euzebya sp. TaxID=1971409 RepID=UPI0035170E53